VFDPLVETLVYGKLLANLAHGLNLGSPVFELPVAGLVGGMLLAGCVRMLSHRMIMGSRLYCLKCGSFKTAGYKILNYSLHAYSLFNIIT
jgi:hypothetical protein